MSVLHKQQLYDDDDDDDYTQLNKLLKQRNKGGLYIYSLI